MSESIPTQEQDLMKMSFDDFDQGPHGWRKLQNQGEFIKAADSIRDYLALHGELVSPYEKNILFFHRGQMLAIAGPEYRSQAVESFKHSIGDLEDECWNAYVSATVGFLEDNTQAIEQAIQVIESSSLTEKRAGNIGIVKNFKKALEQGERNYTEVYSWPRGETT